MENYEKLKNLFELVLWMHEAIDGVSIEDIEKRYKISRRTAERWRNELYKIFPNMIELDHFKYGKVKRWRIPQRSVNFNTLTTFSAQELAVFNTAIATLERCGMHNNAKILREVEIKVRSIIRPEYRSRITVDADAMMSAEGLALRPGPKVIADKEVISKIRDAILSLHQIKISYLPRTGKVNQYTLMPYGIVYGDRNHYLLARHSDGYDDGKPHHFILSNIQEIEILPETYNIPDDFSLEKFTERSFGVFQEEPFEVEWLFDKDAASDAKRFIFHPTQEMIENPDGSLTVKFKAGGRREMDWHLYTWGNHVKVKKPKDWYETKLDDMYAKKKA